MKRRKEAKSKSQLCFVSVEEMAERVQDEDITSYDITDPEMNTEAIAIARMELDL